MEVVLVILIGLGLGSFATALAWRVPRGISWAFAGKGEDAPRSRCPSCSAILGWRDLVPLLSWVSQRGRCRHCGAAMGVGYPLTELGVLCSVAGVWGVAGFSGQGIAMMAAVPFFAAAFVVDSDRMILPDQLTLAGAAFGFVHAALAAGQEGWGGVLLMHGGGAIAFAAVIWLVGLITEKIIKKETLGFGDVKLMAVAGLWLGLPYLSVFFILSGVLGVLWGAGWRILRRGAVFPFGPALILALYACLLLQKAGFPGVFLPS